MNQPQRDAPTQGNAKSDQGTSALPGAAGQKAQAPAGARTVESQPGSRSDEEIRAELGAIFQRADDVDVGAVELMVSDGVVVMLGTVPDYQVKRRLHALCGQLAGVREIHDQLLVRGGSPSDGTDGLRMEAPSGRSRSPSR